MQQGGRKEGKVVSQIMALGMEDKASRLRSSENSPTTEIAKLQTRLDCSLGQLGKCLCSYSTCLQCLTKRHPEKKGWRNRNRKGGKC